MDDFTRDLELMEVIAASDAMVNARVGLEAAEAEGVGGVEGERWEAIQRFVFPLLEAEGARLGVEYRRLRGASCGRYSGSCPRWRTYAASGVHTRS